MRIANVREAHGHQNSDEYQTIVERMQRNNIPYSRSSDKDPKPPPGEGAGYVHEFNGFKVPIMPRFQGVQPTSGEAVFKYGCSNDLKSVWRKVTDLHRYRARNPAEEELLNKLLQEHNLQTKEDLERQGPARKRRKAKAKRVRQNNRAKVGTNTHME